MAPKAAQQAKRESAKEAVEEWLDFMGEEDKPKNKKKEEIAWMNEEEDKLENITDQATLLQKLNRKTQKLVTAGVCSERRLMDQNLSKLGRNRNHNHLTLHSHLQPKKEQLQNFGKGYF